MRVKANKISALLRRLNVEKDLDIKQMVTVHEGDVVVAEVLEDFGSLGILEVLPGRDAVLYKGDLIVTVLGSRESTRWAVGGIPSEGVVADGQTTLQILSPSGILGLLHSLSITQENPCVRVKLLGAVVDSKGSVLNIRKASIPWKPSFTSETPLIFILGTAAEVGKTTAATKIIHELASHEMKVGAAKLTGTGSLLEILSSIDAGAIQTLDFVDAGLPSTYPSNRKEVIQAAKGILYELNKGHVDVIVCELGGDIIGANVLELLSDNQITESVCAIVLVASDSLAALGSSSLLRERLHLEPDVITGPCCDTSTIAERTSHLTNIPAYSCMKEEELKKLLSLINQKIKFPFKRD